MVVPDELVNILRNHTCLYASFDESIDAELSRGDARAVMNPDVVRREPQAGRFGGALVFNARDHGWEEDEFLYSVQDNFPYREQSFDGTISLWLSGDPDADLSPQYPVDPFHISRHAADASFYLDLTRPNDWRYGSPRKLRFGFYNDSPEQNMFVGGQLIVAGELGWSDRKWHHVVAAWRNANSGLANGLSSWEKELVRARFGECEIAHRSRRRGGEASGAGQRTGAPERVRPPGQRQADSQ